jgi:hypothetical protein
MIDLLLERIWRMNPVEESARQVEGVDVPYLLASLPLLSIST